MDNFEFRQMVITLRMASKQVKAAAICILLASVIGPMHAQQLFVNSGSGADINPGTKEFPIKSVAEAARRVNADTTSKSSEVIVSPGLYVLSQTALFKNSKTYTATDRLVIRAESLPDDPTWHPQQMPTIVTAVPLVRDERGESGKGIQIEVSHATIQGLRFVGGLDFYYESPTQNRVIIRSGVMVRVWMIFWSSSASSWETNRRCRCMSA